MLWHVLKPVNAEVIAKAPNLKLIQKIGVGGGERDNPLLTLDNVFLRPHVAWLTQETLERSLAVAVENCRRLESGEDLLHQVL